MSPSIPDSAFRLKWRPSRLGSPNDSTARDGEGYCRIYRHEGGPKDGRWYWCAARTYNIGTGDEAMAREAALAAETAFLAENEKRPPRERRPQSCAGAHGEGQCSRPG